MYINCNKSFWHRLVWKTKRWATIFCSILATYTSGNYHIECWISDIIPRKLLYYGSLLCASWLPADLNLSLNFHVYVVLIFYGLSDGFLPNTKQNKKFKVLFLDDPIYDSSTYDALVIYEFIFCLFFMDKLEWFHKWWKDYLMTVIRHIIYDRCNK